MHLPTLTTLLLAALATAAPSTSTAPVKRCRMGYQLRPCWIRWDDYNCVMYIPAGVTYDFDDAAKTVTIRGLCASCGVALAREETGARDDTWATSFGDVQDLGNGTFMITDTGGKDAYFNTLRGLRPDPEQGALGGSCVYLGE
ncbi:hypothetical protein QBC39DRAFT_268840 [Podospora conica]|nr:hypothetical protein QBC39DRAFT_268840 [Schizothecium conicum]